MSAGERPPRALENSYSAFLPKPLDLDTMLDVVERSIRHR